MASWISSEKISASGWSEGSVATIRLVLERGISPVIQRTDFGVGKRLTGAGSARAVKGARKRTRRNWARDFMEILEVGYEWGVKCGELWRETKTVG